MIWGISTTTTQHGWLRVMIWVTLVGLNTNIVQPTTMGYSIMSVQTMIRAVVWIMFWDVPSCKWDDYNQPADYLGCGGLKSPTATWILVSEVYLQFRSIPVFEMLKQISSTPTFPQLLCLLHIFSKFGIQTQIYVHNVPFAKTDFSKSTSIWTDHEWPMQYQSLLNSTNFCLTPNFDRCRIWKNGCRYSTIYLQNSRPPEWGNIFGEPSCAVRILRILGILGEWIS